MRQRYAPPSATTPGRLGVAAQRGDVVHEHGAELERAPRDLGLRRVDRDRDPGEALENRLDARDLLLGGHGLGARARRLTADVDERGAFREESPPVRDRVGGSHELASVGETVRRDIQHADDRRPRKPFLERRPVLGHVAERSAARIRRKTHNPAS